MKLVTSTVNSQGPTTVHNCIQCLDSEPQIIENGPLHMRTDVLAFISDYGGKPNNQWLFTIFWKMGDGSAVVRFTIFLLLVPLKVGSQHKKKLSLETAVTHPMHQSTHQP